MTKNFRIDKGCVVVRNGDVLPAFCVKTNQQVSGKDYGPRQIKWTKEVRGPKFMKIISYFTSRQYCSLTYGISSGFKTKALVIFLIKIALLLIGIFGLFAGAAMLWNQFVILGFLAIGLVAAILLPFGNQPLAIVHEENGEFWLKGCSKEYLNRIQKG